MRAGRLGGSVPVQTFMLPRATRIRCNGSSCAALRANQTVQDEPVAATSPTLSPALHLLHTDILLTLPQTHLPPTTASRPPLPTAAAAPAPRARCRARATWRASCLPCLLPLPVHLLFELAWQSLPAPSYISCVPLTLFLTT